jgi:hypothetical protein
MPKLVANLRKRLIAYIKKNPGKTSTEISKAFGDTPGGKIYSWIWREWKKGTLERRPDCGPRRGYGYFLNAKLLKPFPKSRKKTWHQVLLEDRLDNT